MFTYTCFKPLYQQEGIVKQKSYFLQKKEGRLDKMIYTTKIFDLRFKNLDRNVLCKPRFVRLCRN
jgi:hypothetical protein